MFGELGIQNNKQRLATITCAEDSIFATLSKKDYKGILEVIDKKKRLDKCSFFWKNMFPTINNFHTLNKITYQFKLEKFKSNKILY